MSHCEQCDEPMLWGGMQSVPHTEEQHAAKRRRWISCIYDELCMEVARRVGHVVAVRFTQNAVWTECSCGWDSYGDIFSSSVQWSGRRHLEREGYLAAVRIRRDAYLDRLLSKTENTLA